MTVNMLKTIIRAVPKLEGSAGTLRLGAKQIDQIASHSTSEARELLQSAVRGVENPSLEIAYKAKSNYAIAGLKVKDGEKLVRQGAFSLSPEGSAQIGKYHLSGNDGEMLTGNFRYTPKAERTKDVVKVSDKKFSKTQDSLKFKKIEQDKTIDNSGKVIPGVPRPADKVIIDKISVLKKLEEYAKTDRVEFEKLRQELSKHGYQAYFDPRTGKPGIMKAKNMEEVAAKLRRTKSPMTMTADAQTRYNLIKKAQYDPQKMYKFRQQELEKAFENFEDKVPLIKREWLEILHQNVDDIVNSRFIG